jgi:hypothetical protein
MREGGCSKIRIRSQVYRASKNDGTVKKMLSQKMCYFNPLVAIRYSTHVARRGAAPFDRGFPRLRRCAASVRSESAS